ncbi:hypothetical protein SAMN04515691_1316 [Leifsonia sp. 98AMF]|uniref:hypothetical protein n=1 Tax=unclassified Leifsonia TaxID=2663824 RepID=UPI000879647E|nr:MULTISPECIES: hypothetical protein [unclassified Leifsonia]SDH47637.1 hypothetical protein SAMN04515690_2703 [Leifsonia sp. 197AMF]SDI89915.1 hypothetical protein SAMN04515684_1083 [Leifsonia sp. 466MF]SDJ90588.1 hypothetical protein SAMN04515683_1665 [Leifsonia sp. 157MF]SDN93606.1 hypothetical protein SAMN04515686_3286 [Leifsonia sp. 509MF]SEN12082.1 hypothetical protein SAMN04515685_1650 [Leifsonia sp. 467MF]
MSQVRRVAADGARLFVWILLPVLLTACASVLGVMAAGDPGAAPTLRFWAIIVTIALGILLLVKGVRDYLWGRSLDSARYDAVRELHNTLGPALDMMTKMAIVDRDEGAARRALLEKVAEVCCSALVAMTPKSAEVRAVVFELSATSGLLEPIARFGRRDVPRTFDLTSPAGEEIVAFLEDASTTGAELYPDIKKHAPVGYAGDRDRYRTFIRAPIWANDVVFGMIAVDAPRRKSLVDGDKLLAELVAAELATAFALNAP